MPGPRSHGGWRRQVRIARNAADEDYGATPSPLTWSWVPLPGDGMKQRANAPRHVPCTNYATDFRRLLAVHHRMVVEGNLVALLWPEVAQTLLDMALARVTGAASPSYQDLCGHVIEHHTPDETGGC